MRKKNIHSLYPIRIVITGGPGFGKTTLLNYISRMGYSVEPEAARQVIKKELERKIPVLPWNNRHEFDKRITKIMIDRFCHTAADQIVFFDRALPDLIGWCLYEGIDYAKYLQMVKKYRYFSPAFFVKPNRNKYVTDAERVYDYEAALRIHYCLKEGYKIAGYELVSSPTSNIPNAAEWLLTKICTPNREKMDEFRGHNT